MAHVWRQLGLLGRELTGHGHQVLDVVPGLGCQAREMTATIRLLTASPDQHHHLSEQLDLHELAALDSVHEALGDPRWMAHLDGLRAGRPLALLRLARDRRTATLMADPALRARVRGLRPTDLVALMDQAEAPADAPAQGPELSWLDGVIDGVVVHVGGL